MSSQDFGSTIPGGIFVDLGPGSPSVPETPSAPATPITRLGVTGGPMAVPALLLGEADNPLREEVAISDRLSSFLLAAFADTSREEVGVTDRLTASLFQTFQVTLRETLGLDDRLNGALITTIQRTLRETLSIDNHVRAAIGIPYAERMVMLTHINFDEGREGFSTHIVTAPSHGHEGKVIQFGTIQREVEVPAGPLRLADMRVVYSDNDRSFRRRFGAKTPRMRTADFLIGPVPGKESLYQRPGKMTITGATFPPLQMILEGSDLRFEWLLKPLPNVINRTNYPNLPAGITEAFFPFGFGSRSSDQGVIRCIHVDTVLHRYTALFHPMESATVYTKTPEQQEFTVTPYGYTLVQDPLILDGRVNNATYIQFASALPEGTEVRMDFEGVNFRGGWGTLPPLEGVSRNLVDHLINILFYIKRLNEPEPDFSDYEVYSFANVRQKLEDRGWLADYIIDRSLTAQEILTQMCAPFIVHLVPNNNNQIKLVMITDDDFADAPTIDDDHGILLKSEVIYLANPTKNKYRYNYGAIPVDGQWASHGEYENTADRDVLGKTEELELDFHSVSDQATADALIAERSLWEDHEAHRITCQIEAKKHLTDIDLLKPIKLSNYGGLAEGGWTDEFFIPYSVSFDPSRLLFNIAAIRRPLIQNPQPQLGTIGDWKLNARGGPEYLTSARRLFQWFADTRASSKAMVVLGSDSDGAMIPLGDGVYPELPNAIVSYDGLFEETDLHIVTQEENSGRVAYTKFLGASSVYDENPHSTVIASNSNGDLGVTIAVQRPSGKPTIMFQGDREHSDGFPPFPFAGPAGDYKRAYVTVRNTDGTWTAPQMMGNPANAFANLWIPAWGDPDYNGAVHVNVGRAVAGLGNRIHFFFSRTEPGDVASTQDLLVQTLRSDGTLSETVEWKMTIAGENTSVFVAGDPCSFEDDDGQYWIAVPIGLLSGPCIALWKDIDNLGVPDNIVRLDDLPSEVQPDTFGRRYAPINVRYFEGQLHVVHGTRETGTGEWAAYKTISAPFATAVAVPAYTTGGRDHQLGPVWPESAYARHGFDIKRLRDGKTYIFKATAGNFGVTEAEALHILEVIDVAADVPASPSFTIADWVAENG